MAFAGATSLRYPCFHADNSVPLRRRGARTTECNYITYDSFLVYMYYREKRECCFMLPNVACPLIRRYCASSSCDDCRLNRGSVPRYSVRLRDLLEGLIH